MPREQLKRTSNDWQTTQIPATWAGEPISNVEIHLADGGSIVANPTDWVVRTSGRLLVLTDAEHTAAFEPWVP